MIRQLIFFAALLALVSADVGSAVSAVGAIVRPEYVTNPSYSYSYDVSDALTGDPKGRYFLVDPESTRRTVQYTANDANGFNAVVRSPLVQAVRAVPVGSPVISSPVAYRAYSHPYISNLPFDNARYYY